MSPKLLTNTGLRLCAVLAFLLAFWILESALSAAQPGQDQAAIETELKEAWKLQPNNFDANYRLGEFYLHTGKLAEGIPYMEEACRLAPSNDIAGYDLALAYLDTRQYPQGRRRIESMLRRSNSAELHGLLADTEEGAGNYLAAAREYQKAAQLDPAEERIFDWGSELLVHQTYDAAIQVFTRGVMLHPHSAKLNAGLGVAFYLHGEYAPAIKALCTATDLDPSEAWPYLFLGKIYNSSAENTDQVRERLRRFAQRQPDNPQALYYYALSLWNRQRNSETTIARVESLLKKAVLLDNRYADGYVQLGILEADRRNFPEAIRDFQHAVTLQPNLTLAHYHLSQAYRRTGQKDRANRELEIFGQLRKQDQLETEKERSEVRQFVVNMKDQGAAGGPVR